MPILRPRMTARIYLFPWLFYLSGQMWGHVLYVIILNFRSLRSNFKVLKVIIFQVNTEAVAFVNGNRFFHNFTINISFIKDKY